MAQRIFTLILLLCSTSVFAGLFDAPGRSHFVPADQAFAFDFQQNQHDLNLTWQIKDGYYLYRKQIRITPEHAKIADVQLPQGVWHEDEFYGKSEIYRDRLTLPVTINQASAGATLTVTYQGCADAGFCYPPETKTVPLSEVVANNAASQPVSVSQQEQHTAQLPFSALWALLIGIGIAFTPCVLPMYPLISGIVLGGKQRLSTARALLLTFIYVQGMALTYTALGLVVAAAGLQFPGGATAPIRAHWPRHRLYLAGDVNVWLVYSTTPLFAANTSHVDEQSPTGRLTWRCVCYGGDCRTDLFTMHHRTA